MEVIERAQRLARKKGVSVTAFLRETLRDVERSDEERVSQAYVQFRERTKGLAEVAKEYGLTSDHG